MRQRFQRARRREAGQLDRRKTVSFARAQKEIQMSRRHPSITGALCAIVFSCSVIVVAQDTTTETSVVAPSTQAVPVQELPDSPGTVWAKSQNPVPQTANPQTAAPQSDTSSAGQDSANKDRDKNDQKLQRPVGTAAAEGPKVSGITAAEPAGAAIAPAKQHRVRTLVIKVGAILGAGAAIGTVVALSAATPSKPPGAH